MRKRITVAKERKKVLAVDVDGTLLIDGKPEPKA